MATQTGGERSMKITSISSFSAQKKLKLPFFVDSVPAGFPSPADDYQENSLDLNEHLIKHPSATFFVKVSGDSMINAGIFSGDTLIVDRALTPRNNQIVVAAVDGEFTVKRFQKKGKKIFLAAENPDYHPLEINEENDFQIWGVVIYVIHQPK